MPADAATAICYAHAAATLIRHAAPPIFCHAAAAMMLRHCLLEMMPRDVFCLCHAMITLLRLMTLSLLLIAAASITLIRY